MVNPVNLPDWRDAKALAAWLAEFPRPLIAAFACRMALIAAPGLGILTPRQLETHRAITLVTASFHCTMAAWVAAKYPSEDAYAAAGAADVPTYVDGVFGDVSYAAYAAAFASAAQAPAAADAAAAAVRVAADRASIAAGLPIEIIGVLIEQAQYDLVAANERTESAAWFLAQLIVVDRDVWVSLQRSIKEFFTSLPTIDGWDVWRAWVMAKYDGGADWPKAVYDELTKWRDEWHRPPAEVNADIKRLLEESGFGTEKIPEQELALRLDFGNTGLGFATIAVDGTSPGFAHQLDLHEKLRQFAALLKEQCAKTHNVHAILGLAAEQYLDAIDQPLERLNLDRVWANGVLLASLADSYANPNLDSMSPSLEPEHLATLKAVAAVHGGFILGTERGAELSANAANAVQDDRISSRIVASSKILLNSLKDQNDWIHKSLRDFLTVLEGRYIEAGWHVTAIGYSAFSVVKNALIVTGRVLYKLNVAGGTLLGSVALGALDPGFGITLSALKFFLEHRQVIMEFAAPFPELRNWLELIMTQIEARRGDKKLN